MRLVVLLLSLVLALPGQPPIPQAQVYLTSENRRELRRQRKRCPGRTLFNPGLFGAEYRVAARCQFSPARSHCHYSAPNNARPESGAHRLFRAE
jgi:hypothetical protein